MKILRKRLSTTPLETSWSTTIMSSIRSMMNSTKHYSILAPIYKLKAYKCQGSDGTHRADTTDLAL